MVVNAEGSIEEDAPIFSLNIKKKAGWRRRPAFLFSTG